MSFIQQRLGSTKIVDRSTGLELSSSTTAYLVPASGNAKIHEPPDVVLPPYAWISAGHRLVFEVAYSWDGSPELYVKGDWLPRIRSSIDHLNLWSRRHLVECPFELAQATNGSSNAIAFNLGFDHEPQNLRKTSHRLLIVEGSNPINPPPDVPHYLLSRVRIDVNISKPSGRSLQAQPADLSRGPMMVLEQLLAEAGVFTPEHLGMLTVYLVLLSISRKTKKPQAVTLVLDERERTLCELAPLVWREDYSTVSAEKTNLWQSLTTVTKAISHRACFLPSIKHSVARLGVRNVRTSSLRAGLSVLDTASSPNAASVSESTELGTPRPDPNIYPRVEAKLWRVLQQTSSPRRKTSSRPIECVPSGVSTESMTEKSSERQQAIRPIETSPVPLRKNRSYNNSIFQSSDDDQGARSQDLDDLLLQASDIEEALSELSDDLIFGNNSSEDDCSDAAIDQDDLFDILSELAYKQNPPSERRFMMPYSRSSVAPSLASMAVTVSEVQSSVLSPQRRPLNSSPTRRSLDLHETINDASFDDLPWEDQFEPSCQYAEWDRLSDWLDSVDDE